MEDCRSLAVESNQSPSSIEEMDGYKYSQEEFICNKQEKKKLSSK